VGARDGNSFQTEFPRPALNWPRGQFEASILCASFESPDQPNDARRLPPRFEAGTHRAMLIAPVRFDSRPSNGSPRQRRGPRGVVRAALLCVIEFRRQVRHQDRCLAFFPRPVGLVDLPAGGASSVTGERRPFDNR
jgi:hypothetical protein